MAVGTRVIVADDDISLRNGLVQLLTRSGYDVVGQASDGRQLMDMVEELAPDLVLVDDRMPPTFTREGVGTAREICVRFPSIGILVLSAAVDVDRALELLGAGDRVGYMLKSQIAEPGQLVDAVEQIRLGASVLDPSLVRELLGAYRSDDPLSQLTPDERDVLALMAQGQSDTGIAKELGISEHDVARQVHGVFTKLELPESGTDRHRVLAVLAYLGAR